MDPDPARKYETPQGWSMEHRSSSYLSAATYIYIYIYVLNYFGSRSTDHKLSSSSGGGGAVV